MKIVILDGNAVNPGDLSWDCLVPFGKVTVYRRTGSQADAIAHIGDANIVLTNKTPITEAVLEACPNIRMVGVLATGYNVVDCAATRRRGIPVCNIPDYGTAAVAQFTIGLLLELCHRIGYHSQAVHDGKWTVCPDFCFWDTPQMELAGKTLGIIGFGRIGMAVGRIAKALGMKVLAYSRTEYPEGREIANYVNLDALLAQSDVISLHCPLTPENTGMINESAIAKMKDGAILLNTARGPLLDEAAVAAALGSGKLRGVAADVVCAEPIRADNPLLTAPNCIITPHMAWAPLESRQRILDCTVQNIQAFLSGNPINVVN